MRTKDFELAQEISSCPFRLTGLVADDFPCNKVLKCQLEVTTDESKFHRPEPWIGSLSSAKVLFISSNPGLSIDQGSEREVFPLESWSSEESAEFFVERFNQNRKPVIATFNNPNEPDFLTLSHDGQYRSGGKRPKQPQKTWQGVHKLAQEILGNDCDPHVGYALTEIVHCKSLMGKGVEEASTTCIEKWMPQILANTDAKVIVLFGAKVRDLFAIPFLNAPEDFASKNGNHYKSLTPTERVKRDIFITNYGGEARIVLFNWHPVAAELRGIEKVYGSEFAKWLHSVAVEDIKCPSSNQELSSMLEQVVHS